MTFTERLHDAALTYASLGYRVFPCVVDGKRPATTHGCLDATTDASAIDNWWQTQPYNIGIATDDLLIIDRDPAGSQWRAPVEDQLLMRGAVTRTPRGGKHYWFRQDGQLLGNTASVISNGIDTRGTGGYVLAPPSVVGGHAYEWIVELDVTPDSLPTVPAAIAAMLSNHAARPMLSDDQLDEQLERLRHSTTINDAGNLARCKQYLDRMPEAIQGQAGSTQTFKACKVIAQFGLVDDFASEAFGWYNERRCRPMWTDSREIQHKIRDGLKAAITDKSFGGKTAIPVTVKAEKASQQFYVPGVEAYEQLLTYRIPQPLQTANSALNPSLASIPVTPGEIVLIGGAPGAGKTALVYQLIFDALRLDANLAALSVNVEMSHNDLLLRQLSRLSGIPLNDLRDGSVPVLDERLRDARAIIHAINPRINYMLPPYHIPRIMGAIDVISPQIVVLDYIQRIGMPGHQDKRVEMNAVLEECRQIASRGVAVVILSSLSRSKGKNGSGYDNSRSLGSFRETGEMEYAVDCAYIMTTGERSIGEKTVECELVNLKRRHGERVDVHLRADFAIQEFCDAGLPVALDEFI